MTERRHGTARSPKLPRDVSEEINPDDLPELTNKEFAFVKAILGGKNFSDAYREAYDAERMAPTTIWANASRLRRSSKVTAWLQYLLTNGAEDLTVTKETHLRELERLKEKALEAGNYGAAVQAEQLKGKASGLYTEKIEVGGDHRELATIQADLEREWGRDLAMAMMAKKGLPWVAPEGTRH